MNDLVPVGDESFTDDFVVEIQVQGAVADHELEESRDIGSKHLAGVVRHHRRKIERPENRDSLVNDGFPGASELAVAAALRYEIDDDRAGRHGAGHLRRDEYRCLLAGHGRGRNDHVLFAEDRKSTRLNSSHLVISYAVFCLKKKKKNIAVENTVC